ncbi:hypothetical protein C7S18_24015 (plasmid) [Ahniella affigens]|uniref:Uncharacterized protein n=1 Tax=Ahniella affigens TaxID=2021234 RepID=A0A2P1PZU8_9GAMM|nr:hypothetical protein [Ahniella affigens]AVQ00368.1 hypothetical protein C7S18_24015 [Ahniella affigens]
MHYSIAQLYELAKPELVVAIDALGAPTPSRYWPALCRWAAVLRAYPPSLGWVSTVSAEVIDLKLSDTAKTVKFSAELRNPSGTTIANATHVALIRETQDWERAETNARGDLAKALGYPPNIEALAQPLLAADVLPESLPEADTVRPLGEQSRPHPAVVPADGQAERKAELVATIDAKPTGATIVPPQPEAPSSYQLSLSNGVAAATLTQIYAFHQAQQLGPVPVFETQEAAKAHLKGLRRPARGAT